MSPLPRRAVVTALICLTAMLAGCNHAPSTGKDPESAADAFFASLEKGDAHAAYDNAAFGFQAAQTFDAFQSNAQQLGLIGGQAPAWTRKDINGNEARLDGTVVNQTGSPVSVSVTLTPDGNEWKLFSLNTATAEEGGEPEDRFTLVGKGTGFNDVYHQPMPNPQQLADLVHATMAKFNAAIKSGDFQDFYRSVSQQWKAGERMDGQAAAGVTEKMLKDHFQDFIDKKMDLSGVALLPPVFDRPPLINENGLLDLYGHFDTVEFRVNFFLEYAYELPRWKLFGINLTLTK